MYGGPPVRGRGLALEHAFAEVAELQPAGEKKLQTLVKLLQDRPGVRLEIASHMDAASDLEALKAVVGTEDLPKIKAAVQRLEGSAYRIADALYSSEGGDKKAAAKT